MLAQEQPWSACFVWRAVNALMPIVGGLVPIPVALDAGRGRGARADARRRLRRAAVRRRRLRGAAPPDRQAGQDDQEGGPRRAQAERGRPALRKGAIRSRQLAAARNRMMADVPTADVVLVNPTHVAVALRYEPGQAAPRGWSPRAPAWSPPGSGSWPSRPGGDGARTCRSRGRCTPAARSARRSRRSSTTRSRRCSRSCISRRGQGPPRRAGTARPRRRPARCLPRAGRRRRAADSSGPGPRADRTGDSFEPGRRHRRTTDGADRA